ncbi:MAG: DUF805 domain-containing protein [Gammaproteobacteria bacterium]|nr:DUF805 domain-containing protein [Gammaproteobacteria bacterium]
MDWYLLVLKKYMQFQGRSRRKEYWYFVLFNILISFALAFIDVFSGLYDADTGVGLLSSLYSLALILPSIAVTVRRLHDSNRSGWWLLLCFIPVIGAIVLVVFLATAGDENDNEYGTNPIFARLDILR